MINETVYSSNSIHDDDSIHDIEKVLINYPFYSGDIERCSPIPQKLYNYSNYLIKSKGKQWVIKEYPANTVTERLKLSHQIQLKLLDEGIPIAKLEVTKENTTFARVNGSYYSAHRWVDGNHLSPIKDPDDASENVIEEVASMLGRYHRVVSRKFRNLKDSEVMMTRASLFQSADNIVDSLTAKNRFWMSQYNKLLLKFKKNDFERWIVAKFPVLSDVSHRLKNFDYAKEFVPGDFIPTHNDINWENLIFNEQNELIAIIDFDNVIVAPRVYEVGAAAIVIAGADTASIDHFIDVYTSVSEYVCNRKSLKISMLIKCLRSLLYSIQAYITGRAFDSEMLCEWCHYLDECLEYLLRDMKCADLL